MKGVLVEQFIVILDTPSIKKYVFEASALKDIRGASAILDGLNRGWLLELDQKWSADENIYEKQIVVYKNFLQDTGVELEEFIFANGGSGLMIVKAENESALECLQEKLQKLYRENTCDAIAPLMAWCKYNKDDFEGCMEEVHWILRRSRSKRHLASDISNPWAKYDEELSDHIAETLHEGAGSGPDEKYKWISNISNQRKKYAANRANKDVERMVWKEFEKYLGFSIRPAQSLDCIGEKTDKKEKKTEKGDRKDGKIAVIYADGDSMNRTIKSFISASQYQEFSQKIDQAVREATFYALKSVFLEKLEGAKRACFDIILLGGDDILVVVPAEYAGEFVIQAGKKFSEIVKKEHTLSFGISVSGTHTPFSQMTDQAENCMKNAKKIEGVCSVDFHVNRSAFYPEIYQYREKEFIQKREFDRNGQQEKEANQLICRPFSLSDFEKYVLASKKLKEKKVPASRLYNIAASLKQGKNRGHVGWIQGVGRAKTDQKKALRDLLFCWLFNGTSAHLNIGVEPWKECEEAYTEDHIPIKYICGFHDILEIYDLVKG